MCNTRTAYAVQHAYTGETEALVPANSALGAIDEYVVAQGFAPTSALVNDPALPEWGWGNGVYVRDDGLVGAVFTNYSIMAVPMFGDLEAVCDMAGWAVRARSIPTVGWVYVVDGYDSREDAWEAVYSLLAVDGDVPGLPACVDCAKPLDLDDLRSSDPRRCDSCGMQVSYDRVSAEPWSEARVFDVESTGRPVYIGAYLRTDEDVVVYSRPDGSVGYAPADCVEVQRDGAALRYSIDEHGAVRIGDELVGWVRHSADHGCENDHCLAAIADEQPWHAFPGPAGALATYHYATREAAIGSLLEIALRP